MSRRKPYPRVVFQHNANRVVYTDRTTIKIERRRWDAMDAEVWVEEKEFGVTNAPPWFVRNLLDRLLVISRRRSRRRKGGAS